MIIPQSFDSAFMSEACILIYINNNKSVFSFIFTMYGYQTRCKFCLQVHRSADKCCIACSYCHEYHLKSQMIDSICPHLKSKVKFYHQKDELVCRACQGEGLLEKQVIITLYQTMERYLKRLEVFNAQRDKGEELLGMNKEIPERKLIKVSTTKEGYNCRECNGSGMIQKVINCCLEGCSRCQFERCYINPIWSSYHCQKITFTCTCRDLCISCHTPIEVNSKYCKLTCGHHYHTNCYIRQVHLADSKCVECGYISQQPNFSGCSQIHKPPESNKWGQAGLDLSFQWKEQQDPSRALYERMKNFGVSIDCNEHYDRDAQQDELLMREIRDQRNRMNSLERRPIQQEYSMQNHQSDNVMNNSLSRSQQLSSQGQHSQLRLSSQQSVDTDPQ